MNKIEWKRKEDRNTLKVIEKGEVCYLSFYSLEESGLVKQGFSTKFGGVSEGHFATMNFSFSRGDNPEHVLENYRRMAEALGVDRNRMVVSYQTHTTNIRRITGEDEGKGVIRERDYQDIDGLITDIPGITLVTFYADCVPLYFLDPVHKAIGLSHSGWRGTVNRMGFETVLSMQKTFGTSPKDVIVCIGPSICQDCYEVGEEVAQKFQEAFCPDVWDEILVMKPEHKYQLDLWKANRIALREAGVLDSHIFTTDICTRCNSDNLFSHRKAGEKRGNAAAFLCLKE